MTISNFKKGEKFSVILLSEGTARTIYVVSSARLATVLAAKIAEIYGYSYDAVVVTDTDGHEIA